MSSTLGNSAAGNVANANFDRPDRTCSFSPLTLTDTSAPSGNARQMSSNLRPDTVISPPAWTSALVWATSSTSRSVAVTASSPSFATSNTLDRIGIVWRRSTTPITACRGFRRTSLLALNFIDSTC